jgi:hypothetical protein
MPAVPSKRHMNWDGVGFTPLLGTLVPITGVQNVRITMRPEMQTHSGDGDIMPTVKVVSFRDPMVVVSHRDMSASHALEPGTRGTFSARHLDAVNAGVAGGGSYTVGVANGIIGETPSGGNHRQYGDGEINIETWSVDGVTNPLTFT